MKTFGVLKNTALTTTLKLLFIGIMILTTTALNAQYYVNYYSNAGNPGTQNTEGDAATPGWAVINSLGTTNSWSSSQTIPFSFQFYGTTVTGFKASMNGLLTFTTSTSGTPPNANSPLPAFGMPNKTIACFWDEFASNPPGSGGTDQVVTKTFGTAPNRQLWIKWFSVEIGANSDNTWAYFSCVLEETTNKIYMVDHNYATGKNYSMTVGLQNTSSTAIMATGSPNITIDTVTASTAIANNDYYEFEPPFPMNYSSSTTTQNSNNVLVGSINQQIIGIQVVAYGNVSPLSISSFALNTNGTTNTSDISNAKLYYTSTTSTFSTTSQFGSTVAAPNGNFIITGSQTLASGTNYFWLTYDIKPTATITNKVDAQCTQIGIGTYNYTPTVTSPAGDREIQNSIIIGNGTNSNTSNAYPSPYANYYWGGKNQMLILASELLASGMSAGQINSLAFDVANVNSCPALVNFEIKLMHTNISAVATTWETGLTSVYSTSVYQPVNGWNTHTFSTPFIWDGISNILVETCFNNSSWVNNGNASVSQTTTPFVSTHEYHADNSTVCSSTLNSGTYSTRPNMRFGLPAVPSYDAGIQEIEPNGLITSTSLIPIKIKIKNFGAINLTKATINWEVDGVPKTPYVWTGNLSFGSVSPNFTLTNQAFSIGSHTIKAWTINPNDSLDGNSLNDTLSSTIYVCTGPLSGSYSIGGASANFQTFTGAINTIINCGISGPITFNVNPGTYYEQLVIPQITGVTSTNNIKFISQNGDSTSVVLTYSPTSATENYTVKLSGADYITFEKITISSTGSTYARVIEISDSSSYNNFRNNIIEAPSTTSNLNELSLVYSPYTVLSEDNNNSFKSNHFKNGSYGLFWSGRNISNIESGTQILNNVFENQFYRAMYILYQDAPLISGNSISAASTSSYIGIYCYGDANSININSNKISLSEGIGIYLSSCNGTTTSKSKVYNNFVHISSTAAICYGIILFSSTNINTYYNSVNISGTATTSRAIYFNALSDDLTITNNIFANNAGGYSFYTLGGDTSFTSNYNNLFTTGTNLGFIGSNRTSLAAWKTASNGDANSVSINPMFATNSDLHIGNQLLDNLGTPISQITIDIDGETRSTSTPDIGADEFTLYSLDLGAVQYVNSGSGSCYSTNETVTIRVKNFGTASINFGVDSAKLYVSVTGPNPTSFPAYSMNSGYFPAGATADVVVSSNYNMSAVGTYVFNAYTVLQGDGNSVNNAMPSHNVVNTYITTYPVLEDIESFVVGTPGILANGWTSISTGAYDWRVDNGGTPSAGTGPTIDHTLGTAAGKYMYTEASVPAVLGEEASFLSPCINFSNFPNPVLKFWYHMYGDSIGSLNVDVFSNGVWTNNLWSKIGPQQATQNAAWQTETIDLSGHSGVGKVRFRAIRGNDFTGDIAIDDIIISSIPDVNLGPDTILCTGNSLLLDAGAGTGYTYVWRQLGSSTIIGAQQTLTVSSGGTYHVLVSDIQNFTNADTIVITQASGTNVSFSGLPSNACINASAITLTGSPTGGTFSGNGISGNIFNPSTAGIGVHSITYSYTNANSCTNSQTQNITVNSLPQVSFSGLATSYCLNASVATLTGLPSGGTFSGSGISGINFNPVVAGVGTHNITYSYTDGNGCSNSSSQNVTVNSMPIVSFSGLSASQCLNAPNSTLTGTPSGGVFSGNGVSGNVFSPSIAGTGTFTISYTYTDMNNCVGISSQQITVNSSPTANAGTDSTISQNTSITLSGSASGGSSSYSYSWSPASSLVNANIQNPVTISLTTTTLFTLTVTDNVTSCSSTDQVLVTVTGGVLSVSCTATPNIVCVGSPVQLNALPSGGSGIYTYSWTSVPAGFTSTMQNPIAYPTATTTYHCTIYSGTSSTSSSATVLANSLPYVNISGLSTSYCSGHAPVNIIGTPGGGTFNGPGISGTTFNPGIVNPGNHNIIYNYVDLNGCANADTVNLNLYLTPTANAGSDISQHCSAAGQYIGTTPQSGLSYQWSPSAGLSNPNIANPFASPLVTMNYILTVTDTSSGCFDTDDILFAITGNPTANVSPSDTIICNGDIITLTASGGTTYSWSNGGNTASINVSPTILTEYIVTVTSSACSDIDTAIVDVSSPVVNLGNDTIIYQQDNIILNAGSGYASYLWSTGDITQTITVYGSNLPHQLWPDPYWVIINDNLGCVAYDTILLAAWDVSIDEVNMDININIFPNPSKGQFNVEIETFKPKQIELCIFNLQGQLISCRNENLNFSKNIITYDYSTLPKGIYYLRLKTETSLIMKKLVIQ
ncbi:MAG: T9SS type A sorting domain-containing protein [Saprospiraceae bacterium]|nr:T9SS type A sorting domain-containing protein [Saprospiraceae bacterium]